MANKRGKRRHSPPPAQMTPQRALTLAADRKAQQMSFQRMMLDGYINTLAYLGEASEQTKANDYKRHSITAERELLTVLYRENWLAKKIIDMPSEDMTRAWYSISSSVDQEKLNELARLEQRHGIKSELTDAIKWARLYGGSAAVMVLKGQEDMLDQPLNYDDLMPGCFRGVLVVDRTDGLFPSIELEEDMDDPDYNTPMYYNVYIRGSRLQTLRVHHSRMLLFHGRKLPPQEEINEDYWGAAELEHIYEELQKRNATSANIAQLIFQANVAALKMADYSEILGMGTEKQKQRIYEAIFQQNRLKNNFGLWVMGAGDSYEQHPYSFSGISDVYETFMLDMAGAAEIPATRLFGRAPQGMNSTGESDMKNYYEKIAQLQERMLKPQLEKLLPVMAISLWGEIPDDMEIVFEPLMTTTPAERSQINQQLTQTIISAYSAGLIDRATALKELQELGKPIGVWTNITPDLVEQAEREPDLGEGLADPMGMFGGLMPGEAKSNEEVNIESQKAVR